ncbi:cation diffusion facilitator family transporter [Clostridium sp. CX1]|uniref:Cation diffusion facilitator family transporter n=1 Tax=Clostridium tanneri TaxID=3037988 RepID=A0ABU4JR15_9CLOT|nr:MULTISPECIES: cation diffusion facilitator family transporter [unclassified Clostridium]MCT8977377.1 cation diffusion facilitator family transporter [Clostridium sp. CX1]MDW8800572.1 cation diffusion facilitator family transporter [Clostridium sp. A1-XYC3]
MNKQSAAFLSIVSNSFLIILKLTAGLLIGSISVISEAIHSSMDLLASFIAFFSIKKASKAADDEHPFGHGKYENLSGFVEAMLIFLAAAFIIFEAIKKIIYGSTIETFAAGLIVMFISAVVNLVISAALFKISKRENSIALEADAMHLLTDVITAAGVFLGLLIVKVTNLTIIDPITAIIVALLIVKTSINLTKRSIKDLVDSKLPDEDIKKIVKVIKSHDEIRGYHRLRTRNCGPKKEVDIHLSINEELSFVEAHNLCSKIEEDIRTIFPNSYILIHPEPVQKIPSSNKITYRNI